MFAGVGLLLGALIVADASYLPWEQAKLIFFLAGLAIAVIGLAVVGI